MKPLSTEALTGTGPAPAGSAGVGSAGVGLAGADTLRAPIVTAAGPRADAAVKPVRFDRPLLDGPGWGDPRMARQVAEAARVAREQALAAGYAAGWAQGRKAFAERQRREAVENAKREEATRRQLMGQAQTLLAALASTARTLAEDAVPVWEQLTDILINGAMTIASASLGRELASVDSEVLEAIRSAIRLLPGDETLTLHVHPDDAELVGLTTIPMPEGTRIVPDSSITPGTVLARSPLQSLPMDLKAGLRAAEKAIRS